MQNNLPDLFRKIRFILLLFLILILIFIIGCSEEKKKTTSTRIKDKTEVENLEDNTVFDINHVLVDGYSISDMVICKKNFIAAYYANSENLEVMAMLRCYDLDTFKLINEVKVNKVTASSELVCYDNFLYLSNDSIDSPLICYDSNLETIKEIDIAKTGALVTAYNLNTDEIVYVKRDPEYFNISYLCKNNSKLNAEKVIMEINQKNPGDIFKIDKIYFSNNGSNIGFLGQSFQSLELNSESKTVYGIINLETKNIEMRYRENIDARMYAGNMLVHYIDGYQSESSKNDSTVILDLDNNMEKVYETNMNNANLEFSMCGKDSFITVGSDENNSSLSMIMKYYDDNREHIYTQNDGLFLDGASKFVGIYSQKNNILYIYYQVYNDSEQKLYQYIKEINI